MKTNRIRFLFLQLSLCIACTFGGQSATASSVPVLVKDIQTKIKDNANIRNMTAAGSTLFFTAFDLAHGDELWKSDVTGTAMVKDIRPGTGDSYHDPDYLTYWNSFVYFEAYGPNGWSLWKSDGTAANTVEVSSDVDPEHIVVFKGALYFSGYGDGLWKSDGTTAGTVAVMGGIGTLDNLVLAGANRLYFTQGNNLWTSDGTTAGTVLLLSGIYPTQITNNSVNSTLYFQGWDTVNGYRLWTSDGTPAGTVALPYAAVPANLTDVNGTTFFTANDPTYGSSLMKLVGGSPTVVKSGISPTELYNWNGVLYFANANGLWKSDGTLAGTVEVKPSVWPSLMKGVGGLLYFRGYDSTHHYELWSSNGTLAGTAMVKDINPGTTDSNPSRLTNVNGTLFLTATETSTGTQLWKSNGTAAGTVLVQNVSPGTQDANPHSFYDVNGTLYFAVDDYTNGVKLWQSNGTAAATNMIPGLTGSNPVPLANADGTLYFAANSDDLWKRVGTSAAVLVKANVTTNDPSMVSYLNGTLYFRGWDSTHNWEIWKSDGTDSGTIMVKDIQTGSNSSNPNSLTVLNGTLYFIAASGISPNVKTQLWKSNGTDAGTVVVNSNITNVSDLLVVNGKLFFQGDDLSNTNALWVSDGTSTTLLVNSLYPTKLTAVGAALFFQGWTSPTGYELWKSDGSVPGTVLVKDINPGGGSSNPVNLTNVNGTLYFSVWNSWGTTDHDQLWKSDGTDVTTVVVKDLPADYGFTSIASLTSVHGILAFTFMDKSYYPSTDNSAELWISNGTSEGTAKVAEIYPGDFGSAPVSLTMANTPPNGIDKEALFFSTIDPLAGRELFILDFTPPVSAITSLTNGAYLRGTNFIITGTASDSMPGTGVNLVQLSTDNGTTFSNAGNTSGSIPWTSWQYPWDNPPDGIYTLKSKSTDLATNVQNPEASITVTVDNTPPAVTFSMPAVYHSLTVPITFTEMEINPAGYCLTTTNSSAGCGWSPTKPAGNITFTNEGNNTIYAWAMDKAGNVSVEKSAEVIVALPHTLNIDFVSNGGGIGHVYFVQKNSSYNVDIPVTVYSYDPVTLQATPAEYSLFSGWSGICTGTVNNCIYTVPTVAVGGATQTATSTFTFDSGHAVYIAPSYYFTTIGGAYSADTTVNLATIRIFGTSFSENLLFDKGKNVILMGGDNQAHTSNISGSTTIKGTMTIKSGTVTVENLTIRHP